MQNFRRARALMHLQHTSINSEFPIFANETDLLRSTFFGFYGQNFFRSVVR